MHENLELVGGVKYDKEEQEFAEKISASFGFGGKSRDLSLAGKVAPMFYGEGKGSTDVGDVSWIVPT